MTCEVGGVLAQPTTSRSPLGCLINLRVVFIGLFRWSLSVSVLFQDGLLGHESQIYTMVPGVLCRNNGLRWRWLSYQQSGWSSLQKQQCNALVVKSEASQSSYLTFSPNHGFAVAIRQRSDDAIGLVHRKVR